MKNRIKIIRAEQNLTQQALADKMGISRSALNMIENEKTVPDGNTIALLVKALGVPANRIFFGLDVV
jgi:putative transcriptional regulator